VANNEAAAAESSAVKEDATLPIDETK